MNEGNILKVLFQGKWIIICFRGSEGKAILIESSNSLKLI